MNEGELPRLEIERFLLTLPPSTAAARVLSYVQRNRDRFAATMPTPPADYFTEEGWTRRLETAIAEFRSGAAIRFILFDGDETTGPVAGNVSYTNIVREPFEACYLGYRLDRGYEGQGVMSAALRAANRFAFAKLGLHRIMANYVPTNVRSARLLQRLGFVVEGTARAYLHLDGEWRDHVLTALINDQWRPRTTKG